MVNVSQRPIFAQTDSKDKLPPMQNEPRQAEIDAETARRLREAAQERRDQQQKKFVTVVPDGAVFRWQRSDGRILRSSSEAFTSLAEAIQTAIVIAQCYGVPALVPATA